MKIRDKRTSEVILEVEGDTLVRANLGGADLRFANLVCVASRCANLKKANLEGANLAGANLEYAELDGANLRRTHLVGAHLGKATFTRANLHSANLADSNLKEADFTLANLENTNFDGANIRNVKFTGARLKGADLPKIAVVENLFSTIHDKICKGEGRLDMDYWHSCETVHCIAGWAVHLAGVAGRVAEELLSTQVAAALIINQSCPYLDGVVPNFHVNNTEGWAFVERCAKTERSLRK